MAATLLTLMRQMKEQRQNGIPYNWPQLEHALSCAPAFGEASFDEWLHANAIVTGKNERAMDVFADDMIALLEPRFEELGNPTTHEEWVKAMEKLNATN